MKPLYKPELEHLVGKIKADLNSKQDKLTAGNNITITSNTISATDAGPFVDLGRFNDQTELITHVIMNQFPTGQYTFMLGEYPFFMLLRERSNSYDGTFYDNAAKVFFFNVGKTGELHDSKTIDLKDLDLSNDTLETYTEKIQATTGIINLSLANVFTDTPSASRTYSITNAKSGVAHSFTLIITMGATVETLTFPASVKWQGGEIPDMTTASKTYVLTFVTVDGGTTWLGMFGGEF